MQTAASEPAALEPAAAAAAGPPTSTLSIATLDPGRKLSFKLHSVVWFIATEAAAY
jgi:hypothetical protein